MTRSDTCLSLSSMTFIPVSWTKSLIVFSLAPLLAGAALATRVSAGDAVARVAFTVHPDQVICPIPARFTGLSFEKTTLASPHFDPTNSVMVNLLSNLGVGVLRFGGNMVDEVYWSRTAGATFPNARAVIGPADLERALNFSKKISWPMILGLNLAANNPEMAADEAAFALATGGSQLLAFEIGNEPEHLGDVGRRATNYAYADFSREAHAYVTAMRERSGRVPIAGPATTSNFSWFDSFLADFSRDAVMTTRHHYPLTASRDTVFDHPRFCSVENLLKPETAASSMKLLEQHERASAQAGLPFRVGETGSASMGGKDGVSDVFASALWSVDYMFSLAARQVEGVNFHSFFSCRGYTPFCFQKGRYHVHPMYYGMLLFQMAGAGKMVAIQPAEPSRVNISAHGVAGPDGRLRVLFINKSLTTPAQADVTAPPRYVKGELIRLVAPSVTAKEGITLAGAAVQSDGTWTPKPATALAVARGQMTVLLPAASAALVILDPDDRRLTMKNPAPN